MQFSLLDVLTPIERAALESRLHVARLHRGQALFNDGDTGDHLYLVRSGRFDVQLTTPAGTVVVATRSERVTPESVAQVRGHLSRMAERLGGTYQGWSLDS